MKKFATGLSSAGEEKRIQTERHVREYERVRNVLKYEWHISYLTNVVIKEILSGVYMNATRELDGLHAIELEVVYRRKGYSIKTFDDVEVLKGLLNAQIVQAYHAELRKETKDFISQHGFTAEDIAYVDSVEFMELCRAYDISWACTDIYVDRPTVSPVKNWDYRIRRDVGVESPQYDDFAYTYGNDNRVKQQKETLLIHKLQALLTLRYYMEYMPVPVRIITNGFDFKELAATEELPDGWKYTPLSVGTGDRTVDVFPVSASAGRCRKVTGDPCTNPEDFMF